MTLLSSLKKKDNHKMPTRFIDNNNNNNNNNIDEMREENHRRFLNFNHNRSDKSKE